MKFHASHLQIVRTLLRCQLLKTSKVSLSGGVKVILERASHSQYAARRVPQNLKGLAVRVCAMHQGFQLLQLGLLSQQIAESDQIETVLTANLVVSGVLIRS